MNKKVKFAPTLENIETRQKLAENTVRNSYPIGKKKIANVPVELMNIPPYQRDKELHVYSLAENWDDDWCNVLKVNYDENNKWFNIIDGQHRATAARMNGVEYLVCEIAMNLTISEQAKEFVIGNTMSRRLSPFDTFKANQFIVGKDETEESRIDKEIKSLCDKYDIKVKKTNAKSALKSVTVARAIVKRDGIEGLEWVFNVIIDSTWNNFSNGFNGDLMASLGKLYSYSGINKTILKNKLCEFLKKSSYTELLAMGNNMYPNLTRTGRLDAILADVVTDGNNDDNNKHSRITRIA